MACVGAVAMLSFDIFAGIVILGIASLIYFLTGFSRAARRRSSKPAHPHKPFGSYWAQFFNRAKSSSKRNRIVLADASDGVPERYSRHECHSHEEPPHEQRAAASQRTGISAGENTLTPHQAHIAKLRFLIARRRAAGTYSYQVPHTRYAGQASRR